LQLSERKFAEVELVAMISAVMGLLGRVGLAKRGFHGTLGSMPKSATAIPQQWRSQEFILYEALV